MKSDKILHDPMGRLPLQSNYKDFIEKTCKSGENEYRLFSGIELIVFLIVTIIVLLALIYNASEIKEENIADKEDNERSGVVLDSPFSAIDHGVEERLDAFLDKINAGDDISVFTSDEGVLVLLRDDRAFREGSTELLDDSIYLFNRIGDILRHYPLYVLDVRCDTGQGYFGKLLDKGKEGLSKSRTDTIVNYFVNTQEIALVRLITPNDGAVSGGRGNGGSILDNPFGVVELRIRDLTQNPNTLHARL